MIPIKKIRLRKLNMALINPFTTSFGTFNDKQFYIIEAEDEQGHVGYGESVAFTSPWYNEETVETNRHIIKDFLIPALQNTTIKHPADVGELFKPFRRNLMAKAAVEGAIWDLFAKQQNIPLSAALGGQMRTIDVGVSIGIKPSIEDLVNTVRKSVEQGYKRIKIKIKPGWDITPLSRVREEFPDIDMMADANSAYTLDQIDTLKQLDDLNLTMIEQPLAHDDIIDHATLQKAINTPVCLDESIHSLEDTRKAIELGSCRIINIKIGRVGGLTEAKRIHDYCMEQGIDVWCGGMLEAGVGRAHNIALTTLPNFTLPGDTAASSLYWHQDIISPEVTVQNGVIHVPTKPGIGFDIDVLALEKFTVEQEEFSLQT
ncbi:o-succinylbenzoate synthase [Alkalibacillus salilacus]|uniref:o-succinylbenzoate synthase n=1 Tax=Alkalibacillus salilacus TaxID=284582 RepID=A0ABT9VHP7_9BACI|nr:o-succinylbenzoate synthase [Alkalibacillus salilacus]MDQ0160483.1 O-succinylbenzoate synthase [Alkalibacillus salilacus]